MSIFGRIQWWFVGKRLCRQSHYLKTSNGSHYEWILQIKFLHEIYRLSVFSIGKESKKVFFTSVFGKKWCTTVTVRDVLTELYYSCHFIITRRSRKVYFRVNFTETTLRKRYFTAIVSTFSTAKIPLAVVHL